MQKDGTDSFAPLTMPSRPEVPRPASFPLVACIAPLIASGAVWVITQSPLSLVFAVLSPLIALGSLADARWQARKARRHNDAAWHRAVEELRVDIAGYHRQERATRTTRSPPAADILAHRAPVLSRWGSAVEPVLVGIGLGSAPSAVRLHGSEASDEQRVLKELAACVVDAVIDVDARRGVGLIGERQLVLAMGRSLMIQLAHRLSPRDAACVTSDGGWQWVHALPHPTLGAHSSSRCAIVVDLVDSWHEGAKGRERQMSRDSSTITIAIAPEAALLPVACSTVISVSGSHSARVLMSGERGLVNLALTPELVSEARASAYARALAKEAADAGLKPMTPPTEGKTTLADLPKERDDGRPLRAPLAVTDEGPLVLDLDGEGPHAIVAGTTGSGKSELLITWIASIARVNSPHEVTFLLVDFKGGATFRSLAGLPHCVGVITDLDEAGAARALASLRAEIRYRERALNGFNAKSIKDLPSRAGLPRLVIVVDEFAAMVAAFGDLHSVFVDIAARGRSLGVHLILATQRPAGVMQESLLANCGLRLSLRVNNAADSVAVVGSGHAAELPAERPGLVVVAHGGAITTALVAETPATVIRELAESSSHALESLPRRPWLDPLPVSLSLDAVHAGDSEPCGSALVLGLSDEPEEQRQPRVLYDPPTDGSLIVLGAHGSGKSTLLATLAAQTSPDATLVRISRECDKAWDELGGLVERCNVEHNSGRAPVRGLTVLIDDIDSLYARFSDDHRAAFADALTTVLRDGPQAGVYVVATAARLIGALQSVSGLVENQILLRMASRNDHVLAGGDARLYDSELPAGRGTFRGKALQIARQSEKPAEPEPRHRESDQPRFEFGRGKTYALITRFPSRRLVWLRQQRAAELTVVSITDRVSHEQTVALSPDEPPVVYVGDPDSWQSEWGLLTRLRATSALLFDGCSLSDVRALTRRSTLPPPLRGAGNVWVCDEDGGIRRARLFASQR